MTRASSGSRSSPEIRVCRDLRLHGADGARFREPWRNLLTWIKTAWPYCGKVEFNGPGEAKGDEDGVCTSKPNLAICGDVAHGYSSQARFMSAAAPPAAAQAPISDQATGAQRAPGDRRGGDRVRARRPVEYGYRFRNIFEELHE